MTRHLKPKTLLEIACFAWVTSSGIPTAMAAPPKAPDPVPLSDAGNKLLSKYEGQLRTLRSGFEKVLPGIDPRQIEALRKAQDAVKAAKAEADAARKSAGGIQQAKALVDHAKGKWIGGAEKSIAQAEAALKAATTDAQRDAAKKDLAKWQANKQDGIKALKERQDALIKAQADEAKLTEMNRTAQAALARAQADELAAAKSLLGKVEPVLAGDGLDAKLVLGAVLAEATPRGLAGFAQQGREQEALVESLLADPALMKRMLEAGGARFGHYGRAMEILEAIRKASSKSREGTLQRLALAVALEHAMPVAQSNPADQTGAPKTVDPLRRYLQYEKAYLDGELDPAFENRNVWELRMVVDCDAPDAILAWGREMLRNYRPDHVENPDYGWRYSSAVRTEVPYGSQNVKDDLPSLQSYQNIIKDGGVCGRRAFFGRFILQSFGIPTWGVTQHAHAALSHWTPKGWVVNLGAGFDQSWWDKDEAPRSGADFLLETQAREHGRDYLKVLRAQWISRILDEQAYNDRKQVAGGVWSGMAHYQMVALASSAVGLGPLGQELAEANESKEKQKSPQPALAEADRKTVVGPDGVITIPSVAFDKPSGHFAVMKSFLGGKQVHCTGGFKADYVVEVSQAGNYELTARVVTVQEGQKLRIAANDAKAPADIPVPYTVGIWRKTPPVELTLVKGMNRIHVALQDASRGVSIKDFTLEPKN